MPGSGKHLVRFRKTGQFSYVLPRSANGYRVQRLILGYTELVLGTKGCPKWARSGRLSHPSAIKDKPKTPRQPSGEYAPKPATFFGECPKPYFAGPKKR
jgi:hypothetical protein